MQRSLAQVEMRRIARELRHRHANRLQPSAFARAVYCILERVGDARANASSGPTLRCAPPALALQRPRGWSTPKLDSLEHPEGANVGIRNGISTRKKSMLRSRFAVGIVGLAVAAGSVAAQQRRPALRKTSRGCKLMLRSWVFRSTAPTASGSAKSRRSGRAPRGQPAVRADMEEFPASGLAALLLLAYAFQQKNDRIELSMTAAEVKDTLSKQKLEQGQEQGQKDKKSEQK